MQQQKPPTAAIFVLVTDSWGGINNQISNSLCITWVTIYLGYNVGAARIDTWPITLSIVFAGAAMSTNRTFTGLTDNAVAAGIWGNDGYIHGSDGVAACNARAFKIGV